MISRRSFLQIAAAAGTVTGLGDRLGRAAAQGRIAQDDLLRFAPKGQVTLLHVADIHAQLKPLHYREPSLNLGVGTVRGEPPHLSGAETLAHFAIPPASLAAYMLSSAGYEALARNYGRVGGMDRLATLVAAIRAERGADRVLLLDGGDSLQGSYTALQSRGGDMVEVLQRLGVEATTGHWEFTLGAERVRELFGGPGTPGTSGLAFLAGNVRDTELDDPVFPAMRLIEKGGVAVAVIGQAFPYTPIANPRWMLPRWSFGIRERSLRSHIAQARRQGAQVVVLLSHNGFDVDRKLAQRVEGLDVILTAHTHDALPAPVRVGGSLLVASGAAGKCLSRLDLEITHGRVTDFAYALIPVLADAIAPDPAMAALVARVRAPHEAMLATRLAHTDGLIFRRDTFAGTLDHLICDAIMAGRDAEIALSPGFRWGPTLLPGAAITSEDVYNATAITYPAVYRTTMTGARIKETLEAVADNVFNPDPYLQQGGDMVRAGGLGFTVHVDAGAGQRIADLRLLRTDAPIEADKAYAVAGWASVNEGVEGPPAWDVVAAHLKAHPVVTPRVTGQVSFVRADR